MLRCIDCGSVFDDYDVLVVEERVGDYGSAPAYERWNACPFCESTEIIPYDPDDDEDEEDEYIMSMEG